MSAGLEGPVAIGADPDAPVELTRPVRVGAVPIGAVPTSTELDVVGNGGIGMSCVKVCWDPDVAPPVPDRDKVPERPPFVLEKARLSLDGAAPEASLELMRPVPSAEAIDESGLSGAPEDGMNPEAALSLWPLMPVESCVDETEMDGPIELGKTPEPNALLSPLMPVDTTVEVAGEGELPKDPIAPPPAPPEPLFTPAEETTGEMGTGGAPDDGV